MPDARSPDVRPNFWIVENSTPPDCRPASSARNGTLGCPLVEESYAQAVHIGMPVVTPPAETDRPKVCRQDTVTVRLRTDAQNSAMKLAQPDYWGTPKWRRNYARRTHIEGWFGVLKTKPNTDCRRGSHQFRGLALVSLVLACAASITNKRMLRSWHNETNLGDPIHPLLQPDADFYGFTELDADTARTVDEAHAAKVAVEAAGAVAP